MIPKVRKSQRDWKISREEFLKRFHENFYDPYFEKYQEVIEELAEVSYRTYLESRKAPKTEKAGRAFHDPQYELSVEWLKTREAIENAQKEHETGEKRILLISASHRNDHTCPGEISKSIRLLEIAKETLQEEKVSFEVLDLSELSHEYGKKIHPCKACVSTSMPLCHWPCSCYPNHALGQVNDWMNEIYPKWVRAHGIMIITPVYWHQSPSALKLMMDRLVCADGGNPDPTTTQGKDPELAKKLELKGWHYPRHLKGRSFSVVVHGDTVGADDAKRVLCDWLGEMELTPTGNLGELARYIGYFEPYASSHQALDRDEKIQREVRNGALSLARAIGALPKGEELMDPRPK